VEEGTSRQGSRTNNATQSKNKKELTPVTVHDDSEDECESMYANEESEDELPFDDPPVPKEQLKKRSASTSNQKPKSTPMSPQRPQHFSNGVKESTSTQGSRTNNAAQSKTKKRASPVYEDETEIPVVDPVASEPQPKKKNTKKTHPKQKVESTPSPVHPQYSTTISNGSGNMFNHDVGNFKFSTIQDALNDNSVNIIYGDRRKPA
jgi:hypothetical protein